MRRGGGVPVAGSLPSLPRYGSAALGDRRWKKTAWCLPSVSESPNNEQGLFRLVLERPDLLEIFLQLAFNVRRRGIADLEPDHFWRRAMKQGELAEITILRNNDAAVGARVLPDLEIARRREAYRLHMR
jgi:hypothetical protein